MLWECSQTKFHFQKIFCSSSHTLINHSWPHSMNLVMTNVKFVHWSLFLHSLVSADCNQLIGQYELDRAPTWSSLIFSSKCLQLCAVKHLLYFRTISGWTITFLSTISSQIPPGMHLQLMTCDYYLVLCWQRTHATGNCELSQQEGVRMNLLQDLGCLHWF
jgi:hypothetical protein